MSHVGWLAVSVLATWCCVVTALDLPVFRAPAVPLFTLSPYFQVFSAADQLAGTATTYWTNATRQLVGLLRVRNETFCFLGNPAALGGASGVKLLRHESVTVGATITTAIYVLSDGSAFQVLFLNPLFGGVPNPNGGFISWATSSSAPTSVMLAITGELATNDASQIVDLNQGSNSVFVGTQAQKVLGRSGDGVGIDWGYLHLAPLYNAAVSIGYYRDVEKHFILTGTVPASPSGGISGAAGDNWPVLVALFPEKNNGKNPFSEKNGHSQFPVTNNGVAALLYDDVAVIDFFGAPLLPFWKANHSTFESHMNAFMSSFYQIGNACFLLDAAVASNAGKVGGNRFSALSSIAYRQTAAGIISAVSPFDGSEWIFMKEISSDGDISTVDVIFPASPWPLLFDSSSLTKMLVPLMVYAANQTGNGKFNYSDVWAPHQLGVWPICDAQTKDQEPMPVEESANMLLMAAALVKVEGSLPESLVPYKYLFDQWARYLKTTLPDPGDQLCTDDFAGASPHNVNLAGKGIVALAAYSQYLCTDELRTYWKDLAVAYRDFWIVKANQTDHFGLEFGLNSSWSTKYNLFFLDLLQLDVFPQWVVELERSYYLNSQMREFGIPLDNRALYSKSDWQMWMFAGAPRDQFETVVDHLFAFYNATVTRSPLSDWYNTDTPTAVGRDGLADFKARPVVGAFFARQLLDSQEKK